MGDEHPQPPKPRINGDSTSNKPYYKWWIKLLSYGFLVIASQSVGTILGRLYFDKGAKSIWMATLVQVVGFPFLLPIQWFIILRDRRGHRSVSSRTPPSFSNLAAVYIGLGILVAAVCLLFTIGNEYLPVTTSTLLCSSQLAFNALFSFILNRQKLTPYIINSLVILTISNVLLVFQHDPGDLKKPSRKEYAIGFLCTLGASAGSGIGMAVTQAAFRRVIKEQTLRSVVDLTVYESVTASVVLVVCYLVSGDWRRARVEMLGFGLGKSAYVLVLTGMAVMSQVFLIGCIGLIFNVSGLFANVITVVGLPVAPVMAVVFLRDSLTGLKAVAMVMAMWGFVSYIYQQHIDNLEEKKKKEEGSGEMEIVRESG